MRTRVVIVGAGPAGLLLSHLLGLAGVESVLVENRSAAYVQGRIRAGVLESSSVDLLTSVGLGERIAAEGDEHRGHLPPVDRSRPGGAAPPRLRRPRRALGVDLRPDRGDQGPDGGAGAGRTAGVLRGLRRRAARPRERPAVGDLHRPERRRRSGSRPTRSPAATASTARPAAASPTGVRRTWERVYPYAWLGVLADVPPSTDELIYAWHPDGFALHSMRSATVSRLYLQVRPDEDVAQWSDDRIWDGAGDAARSRPGRLVAPARADHREVGAADAVVRLHPDAARPAVPGRRRRAHRAAHRRQGAEPRDRRRRAARPRADRAGWSTGSPALVDSYSGRRPAAGVAVHALLVVDDLDAARDRRPVRRAAPALPAALGHLVGGGAAGLAENYAGLPLFPG